MSWANLFPNLCKESFSYLMNHELASSYSVCRNWREYVVAVIDKRKDRIGKIKDLFISIPREISVEKEIYSINLMPVSGLFLESMERRICINDRAEPNTNSLFHPDNYKFLSAFGKTNFFTTGNKIFSYDGSTQTQVGDLDKLQLRKNGKYVFTNCFALTQNQLIFQCSSINNTRIIGFDVFRQEVFLDRNIECQFATKIGKFFYFFDEKDRVTVCLFDESLTLVKAQLPSPITPYEFYVEHDLVFVHKSDSLNVYTSDEGGNIALLWNWNLEKDVEGELNLSYPFLSYKIDQTLYVFNALTGQKIGQTNVGADDIIKFKNNILVIQTDQNDRVYYITTNGAWELNQKQKTAFRINDFILKDGKLFKLITRSDSQKEIQINSPKASLMSPRSQSSMAG